MIAAKRYLNQEKSFWAHVRSLSQILGYTYRGKNVLRALTQDEVKGGLQKINLSTEHLFDKDGKATSFCSDLVSYFQYRAYVINSEIRENLMDKDEARGVFRALREELRPKCPMPLNKQKGEKKAEAFLTCIVNMLIEKNCEGYPVDFDPRLLTTVVRDGKPIRTLSRRIDGAFPSSVNPIAIWEIKEYYYTTTFGSRVADGVYETLLDGVELEELRKEENIRILHYLFVDDRYTWWECGKSYLCRLIDLLHMGYVDEVIFGKEVLTRLPELVKQWVSIFKQAQESK